MGKQGVTAVENVCNGIDLMRPKHDLRIDSHKIQVAAVILAGANAVELENGQHHLYHRRSFQRREQGHLGGQDEAADA